MLMLVMLEIIVYFLQVRMQAQRENGSRETISQALVKIYKEEGVPGLWRVYNSEINCI